MWDRSPKQNLCKFVVLLFVGLIPRVPAAEEIRAIHCDLPSCVEIAFSRHPLLKTEEAQQSAARSTLKARTAERLPTIDLEGRLGYLNGEATTPFATLGGVSDEGIPPRDVEGTYFQTAVGLRVPLVKDGTLVGVTSSTERQAELAVGREEWMDRAVRGDLASAVAAAYVRVLTNRKAVVVHEQLAASSEEDERLILVRFNQHLVSKNDLLTAEVRLATARRDLSRSRIALRRSQEALATSMGMDASTQVDIEDIVAPDTALLPLEELVVKAEANHPELKAKTLAALERREEADRIAGERYPALTLLARYEVSDDFDRPVNEQSSVWLNLKVPIFDFGLIRNRVRAARAEASAEEYRMADFRMRIEDELRDLYFHLADLEADLELIGKQIEQASEAVKLNRAMFQQGLLSQSAVHDAEAMRARLEMTQAAAEYDRRLTRIRLGWATGEVPSSETRRP